MATRSQRPVREGVRRAPCRIGLLGDGEFVARARTALSGSEIEIAWQERPGKTSVGNASAGGPVNALVASTPADADGVAMASQFCEAWPKLPVIVVVDAIGEDTARAMLRAGARGIVLEDELETALAPGLRAAQVGQIAIPRSGRRQVFRPVLSHRENTVLAMVAQGRSNSQIAAKLHVEESTVKSHLGSLFAKLGVSSREEAAAAVFDGNSQVVSGVMAVTAEHQRPKKKPKASRPSAPSKRPVTS